MLHNKTLLKPVLTILKINSLTLEKLITPESFAEVLCDDLDLPVSTFVPAIVQSMQQQLKQHTTAEPEIKIDEQPDQRVIIKVIMNLVPKAGFDSTDSKKLLHSFCTFDEHLNSEKNF